MPDIEPKPVLPVSVDVDDLLSYHAIRAAKDDLQAQVAENARVMGEFMAILGAKYSLNQGDSFNYKTGFITRKPRQ